MRPRSLFVLIAATVLALVAADAQPSNGMLRAPRVLPSPTNGAILPTHDLPSGTPRKPAGPPLAWDADTKEYTAKPNELEAPFTFNLTNTWTNELIIQRVVSTCYCTVASLPEQPWHLQPGASGQIKVKVNLAGRAGTLSKDVLVETTEGNKRLWVKVNLPVPAVLPPMSREERLRNQALAALDHQAVFKGSCAECHAKPAVAKTGADLYLAACGICHESPQRAEMVPDLRAMKVTVPVNFDFWRDRIANGKPNSLMPAFSQQRGGPLTDVQITALAGFLDQNFPHPLPAAQPPKTGAVAPPLDGE